MAQLDFDNFSDKVGEIFRMTTAGATVDIELIEAVKMGEQVLDRQPFSLLFRAPSGSVEQQQTFRIEHDSLGPLDLFLVPIVVGEKSITCEAVFA